MFLCTFREPLVEAKETGLSPGLNVQNRKRLVFFTQSPAWVLCISTAQQTASGLHHTSPPVCYSAKSKQSKPCAHSLSLTLS